jgi:hypothetical protein
MTILLFATAVMLVGGLAVTVSQKQAAFAQPTNPKKVTICHLPPSGDPTDAETITVGAPSVAAHVRNHGDNIGACQPVPTPSD